MSSTTFHCDCERYCNGERKQVSRSTYYFHKSTRDPISRFSAPMQAFLKNKPVVISTPPSNTGTGSSRKSRKPRNGVTNHSASNTQGRDLVPRPDQGGTSTQDPANVRLGTSFAVQHGNFDNFDTLTGELGELARTPFGNCSGASKHANVLGVSDLHPPEDYLSSHDDTVGGSQLLAPGIVDHQPETSRTPIAVELPAGDIEDLWLQDAIHLNDLKTTAEFVRKLRDASLDDPSLGMSCEALERLRNPLREQPSLSINDDTRLAIDMYLGNPSEATYEVNRKAFLRRLPEADVPSYYKTRRLVADLTGVESVVHHMCTNSCVAYTGPFSDLEACPICSEPRYDQFRLESSSGRDRVPRQEFHTIPIGPQLQALYREPESASHAHYLRTERARVLTEVDSKGSINEYSDVLHGSDLIEAFRDDRIGEDDIALLFSIDGAQLYAKKASACWIYIWVLLNLSPARRYKKKHVFIGGFIPGPNNPKNTDSFLFPGLQHLVGLQKERLSIWDAALQRVVQSKVFLVLVTADGPGMMHITGLVGYHGKHGCRLYCGMPGRREAQGKQYFPALLKPLNYEVEGSTHADIDIRSLPSPSHRQYNINLHYLVTSPNESQYRARRLATGISKPSIFSGLDRSSTLGLPYSAGSDIMHLGALNLSDLMIGLWRGTVDCTKPDDKSTWTWVVLRGEAWQRHGTAVGDTLHYLPSSFDRPPRNIAEKLTSGYKAWEFLLYLYGLCPGLLYGVLPDAYYSNFCKLVFGIRLMNQHKITVANVCEAHQALLSFAQEFEMLYCQRLPTRIHFVRPCIHSLVHLPREVIRIGPPVCSSQWTLERTIGNLGEEIKQHSNPFANLSQRGIRRARINALKAMIPDLDIDGTTDEHLPQGCKDVGQGYLLLRAREEEARPLRDCEGEALCDFLKITPSTTEICVRRWAKLRIPTGQNCYSAWKELERPIEKRRTARNVKIILDDEERLAEVYFFIHLRHDGDELGLALVSLYSTPDVDLLRISHDTLWSCEYHGDSALKFIDVKTIKSVVAMIPHSPVIRGEEARNRFFLVEKPGFDVALIAGTEEDILGDVDTALNGEH